MKRDQLGFLDYVVNLPYTQEQLPFSVEDNVRSQRASSSSNALSEYVISFNVFANPIQEGKHGTMLENHRQPLQSLLGDASLAPWVSRLRGWATQTWPGEGITTIIEGRFKIGPDGASAAVLCLLGYSPQARNGHRFEILSSISTPLSVPDDPGLQ
ncbi:hypothetical protein FA13DRAFT_1803755 [Coprinellus micaceus]|uniref:Uncharacterized protein n=1 Tax=Coprinellus micaceus TaxID=71717 RepID=A0A4Y7SC03_COPMI|nr:hypothetical protein FA13DRAFT_1803755 [Coprinellus micaceus]